MAIMEGTTSPASRSPSPATSDTSVGRIAPPKPSDPHQAHAQAAAPRPSPEPARRSDLPHSILTCEWDECGDRFADVRGLVEHLEHGHIGVHKSSYTCEWASCPRRGLVQTSRFALVSHCRSHTGEKPFVCSVPECDKSFTRSDTLAKHLRQQHNISTPAPTRGGYRKRKRSMTPSVAPPPAPAPAPAHDSPTQPQPQPHPDAHAPSHYNFANRAYAQYPDARDSGFNTFRVNPAIHDRPGPTVDPPKRAEPPVERPYFVPEEEPGPGPGPGPGSASSGEEDAYVYNPDVAGGRSKAMVKYLIMKAKYRYVTDEQNLLSDELEALKRLETEERREKEAGVDRVLRVFGPQSEQLMHDPEPLPTNGKRGRAPPAHMEVDVR